MLKESISEVYTIQKKPDNFIKNVESIIIKCINYYMSFFKIVL